MNTKTQSEKALAVIDQYLHFRVANASCNIPYFNNKRAGVRASLRATIGKGSPKEIFDEVEISALREKVDLRTLSNDTLKKFLIDHTIGIDCSGFVYHVLNAESRFRKLGTLDKHLHFPFCHGIVSKIRCKIRPTENTSVQTIASNANSHVVAQSDIQPGDFITMTKRPDAPEDERARDHIILIHQIEYQNFVPTTIHYSHSMAWPTDGTIGHGVRQGVIEIVDPSKNILEQRWTENHTFARAKSSVTEIRRFNWF